MRHILANYYVKDHFQASPVEMLVWSHPVNLAGEMIKNQNVLIFVPNKSECIDICPQKSKCIDICPFLHQDTYPVLLT